jgi:hypothetical protein
MAAARKVQRKQRVPAYERDRERGPWRKEGAQRESSEHRQRGK